MPQTLEFRLRAVRKSCTTSGANAGESNKNQHSSSTVMLGRPVFPVAREAIAAATSILIAVSSLGSELTFDVEEEPIAIQLHRRGSVEEVRVDATLSGP